MVGIEGSVGQVSAFRQESFSFGVCQASAVLVVDLLGKHSDVGRCSLMLSFYYWIFPFGLASVSGVSPFV